MDLRTGAPEADDPAGDAVWGPERSVRAAVVAALLLGANETRSGAVAALRVAAGWVLTTAVVAGVTRTLNRT